MKQCDDLRPLNRDCAKIRATTCKRARSGGLELARRSLGEGGSAAGAVWRSPLLQVILQPRKIFIRAGRVYHEQILLLVDAIHNQVVNDPAAFVEQKRVLTNAD